MSSHNCVFAHITKMRRKGVSYVGLCFGDG